MSDPVILLAEELEHYRALYIKRFAGADGAVLVQFEEWPSANIVIGWSEISPGLAEESEPVEIPTSWRPGTCAIGPDGLIWVACGGSRINGAKRWTAWDVDDSPLEVWVRNVADAG